MNGVAKVVLIGGGLAAFYYLRKYADKKFAAPAGVADSIIDTVKNMLPADILPETKPTPTPTPSPTPVPVKSAPVESTTPVFQSPTVVKTATPYIQPRLTSFTKINMLDQRAFLAGSLR